MSLLGLDAAPALIQPEVIPGRPGRLLGYNLFLAIVPQAAADGIACPPLPIVFDRACSFRNLADPDNNAFVLRCDARSDATVARLRQTLALALRRSGLHPKPSSTPHMTMLYDQQVIPEHPIEPICWTATRFALILSHRGLRHHEWLGHWQLT